MWVAKEGARRIPTTFFLLLFFIWCVGCAAMPEVGPFVDATVEMRSAVASSGNAVEAALRQMPGDQNYADNFARQWSTRVQAVDTLVDYAESLHAIVQAGQTGGKPSAPWPTPLLAWPKGLGLLCQQRGL